jgi:transposase
MFSWRRGQAYSQDLRDRVLAANELSARQAADRFGVSVSYVIKARQRRDRHGDPKPGPQRSWTPRKLAEHHAAIGAHVRTHPAATLPNYAPGMLVEFGVSASIGMMWNTLPARPDAQKVPRSGRAGAAPILPRRVACRTS